MKLTVAILLLVAACHSAEPPYRGNFKIKDSLKTEKRELEEGNGNVDKRAPAISTVAPSSTPGIEYADTKDSQQDKSPAQQVYATPVPQIAKISDVLTGQGPPFPAAIASHLYSPISIYQPRLGAPTTYEISPPVPSQLAYSEHKLAYQPQQNALPIPLPSPTPSQQPAYQQPISVQPQPLYTQQIPQAHLQAIHQIVPQNYQPQYQLVRPVQYIQSPSGVQTTPGFAYLRNQIQLPYLQAPQHLIPVPVQLPPLQLGIGYAHDASHGQQNLQLVQKSQQIVQQPQQQQQPPQQQIVVKEQEPQQQEKPSNQQQTYSQPQGAVSYASFSQSQPLQTFQPKQQTQQFYQPLQYQQPRITLQFRAQPQPQPQPLNVQVKSDGENLATSSTKTLKPISYFRPGATFQLQPVQSQVLHQQPLLIPSPNYLPAATPSLAVSPTFPPIQYFGKHAQNIFARYSPQR